MWADMSISTLLGEKKKGCVEPQGQSFLGCQLKECLAVLHGKGELIPAGGKAGRRATSQGTESGCQQDLPLTTDILSEM